LYNLQFTKLSYVFLLTYLIVFMMLSCLLVVPNDRLIWDLNRCWHYRASFRNPSCPSTFTSNTIPMAALYSEHTFPAEIYEHVFRNVDDSRLVLYILAQTSRLTHEIAISLLYRRIIFYPTTRPETILKLFSTLKQRETLLVSIVHLELAWRESSGAAAQIATQLRSFFPQLVNLQSLILKPELGSYSWIFDGAQLPSLHEFHSTSLHINTAFLESAPHLRRISLYSVNGELQNQLSDLEEICLMFHDGAPWPNLRRIDLGPPLSHPKERLLLNQFPNIFQINFFDMSAFDFSIRYGDQWSSVQRIGIGFQAQDFQRVKPTERQIRAVIGIFPNLSIFDIFMDTNDPKLTVSVRQNVEAVVLRCSTILGLRLVTALGSAYTRESDDEQLHQTLLIAAHNAPTQPFESPSAETDSANDAAILLFESSSAEPESSNDAPTSRDSKPTGKFRNIWRRWRQ